MADLIEGLVAIVGEGGLLRGADAEPHATDWRAIHRGKARAVVRPRSTEDVARVVSLCATHGAGVVPQGGNTGLAGGATPSAGGGDVVVLLGKLDRIVEIDVHDATMTVEAGVTLAAVRAAAAEYGLMFPISMGSEGSAQIGGVISTNAGGSGTARYGNARDLVLGLEVVLADGRVWDGLRRLRKDNSGYCLRHLVTGAEGTLGIVTAAVLRLVPAPAAIAAAFCTAPSVESVVEVLRALKQATGTELHTFEYMSRRGLDMVLRHIPGTRLPVEAAEHHVLVEFVSSRPGLAQESLEEALALMHEKELLSDAAVAQSETARRAFWRLRESFAEAQVREGPHVKCDISVPVSRIAEFVDQVSQLCAGSFAGCRPVFLSHAGDGNVHCNIHGSETLDAASLAAMKHDIVTAIDDIVERLGGSFSAEHGVGSAKVSEMLSRKSAVELDMMRAIKRALDPLAIMNPGKVIA